MGIAMKKAFCALLASVALTFQGYALEIQGRVVNSEGKPVPKAIVIHRASDQRTQTDEQGRFSLELPDSSRVILEIIHPQYLEEEVSFSGGALSRPLTITLTPYIRQREEVVVTAMRYPEPSAAVPAAASVVSAQTVEEKMPPNVAAALADLPGVAELGSGGFSLVPSIRGLARRRVLLMIDGARLSSDRRTGPSASFISPEDIDRIEVLRSPSSVFYGSDAIGGVVNILTAKPDASGRVQGRVNARYGSVNEEKGLGLALSGGGPASSFYLSAQGIDAANYRSPDGKIPYSYYTQSSVFAKFSRRTERREIEGSFLLARGRDIGKPNVNSVAKPTWYPRENQNLLQVRWREKNIWGGEFSFHVFANPNFLETRADTIAGFKTKESFSRTESTDYGVQLSFNKKLSRSFRLSAGGDLYGRAAAQAVNRDTSLDSQGNITGIFEEQPYTEGARRDLGFFLSGDFSGVKGLDLVAGLRLDFLVSRANPGGKDEVSKNDDTALTGFLAASYKLSERFVIFANLSRAFRAPDLNERFYSGITGRGFIIANPDLKSEASLNFDGGLKFISSRAFIGLYGFYYEINEMIERYRVGEAVYTYGNIDKGALHGLELEWEYFPWSGLSVFGNATLINGESLKNDVPLNDIPPRRLLLGTRAWFGRMSFEINGMWQAKKGDPGPAEIVIPAAQVLNLKSSYYLARSVHIYLAVDNLLNESYLGRPDPEARLEPGRNFLFGISYLF
jgi:hemoglobin/transferrin/lactoferrin receptor protein